MTIIENQCNQVRNAYYWSTRPFISLKQTTTPKTLPTTKTTITIKIKTKTTIRNTKHKTTLTEISIIIRKGKNCDLGANVLSRISLHNFTIDHEDDDKDDDDNDVNDNDNNDNNDNNNNANKENNSQQQQQLLL